MSAAPGRSAARRRRGATFTMVALATGTLLLVSAGVFLRSAGQTVQLAGLEGRRSAAREAAFAGVAWAARDARVLGRTTGHGVLLLDQGRRVEVRYRPLDAASQDLTVVAEVATMPGDPPVVVVATLRRADAGDYVLSTLE